MASPLADFFGRVARIPGRLVGVANPAGTPVDFSPGNFDVVPDATDVTFTVPVKLRIGTGGTLTIYTWNDKTTPKVIPNAQDAERFHTLIYRIDGTPGGAATGVTAHHSLKTTAIAP